MTVKKLMKDLTSAGWTIKSQKGSHIKLIHPQKSGMLIVPAHNGDIPIGTLESIKRQAGYK